MTDRRMEPARPVAESMMANENQQNAGGQRHNYPGSPLAYYDDAPRMEYPRMMYRKTDVEQTQPFADAIADLKDKPMVINNFGGLLCDTTIAHDASEAETLSTNGWDISPQAAHGVVDGLAKVTTAKDDRIAELEAMLTAQIAAQTIEPEKRGPGRPPKVSADA